MTILLRFWKPLLGALLLAGCWLWFQHALTQADAKGYARAREEARIASAAQAERMREMQRAAEKSYVVQAQARDHFIVTTVKEIADAAAPLVDCRVPDAVRLRLNETRACALGDSPASCNTGGSVRSP